MTPITNVFPFFLTGKKITRPNFAGYQIGSMYNLRRLFGPIRSELDYDILGLW